MNGLRTSQPALKLITSRDAASIRDIRITPSISFNPGQGETIGHHYVVNFKTLYINEITDGHMKIFSSNGLKNIKSERQRIIEQIEFYSVSGTLPGSCENMTTPSVNGSEKCFGGRNLHKKVILLVTV